MHHYDNLKPKTTYNWKSTTLAQKINMSNTSHFHSLKRLLPSLERWHFNVLTLLKAYWRAMYCFWTRTKCFIKNERHSHLCALILEYVWGEFISTLIYLNIVIFLSGKVFLKILQSGCVYLLFTKVYCVWKWKALEHFLVLYRAAHYFILSLLFLLLAWFAAMQRYVLLVLISQEIVMLYRELLLYANKLT